MRFIFKIGNGMKFCFRNKALQIKKEGSSPKKAYMVSENYAIGSVGNAYYSPFDELQFQQ